MSNNKQSSVEWLQAIELERDLTLADWNKAKAMHKEEMICSQIDMFIHLNNLPYGVQYLEKRQSAEDYSKQYYNETFAE